tara:strand:- start:13680 stop:13961 length:282 start_codon:yes stop_codon:yes gene_type:complete
MATKEKQRARRRALLVQKQKGLRKEGKVYDKYLSAYDVKGNVKKEIKRAVNHMSPSNVIKGHKRYIKSIADAATLPFKSKEEQKRIIQGKKKK